MTLDRPVRQVAYFVEDVRAAALAHHGLFGSGPYFVAEHIPLRRALHRGVDRLLDHSSAYGQWGQVMIEFVQQNNAGPSAFRDVYAEGQWGIHHVALFVDDIAAELARFAAAGHAVALDAEMSDGFRFAFVDTIASFGHMVELYTPTPVLTGFYATVAAAARDYAGGDVLTTISFE